MRTVLALALAIPATSLAVDLEIGGACPGPMDFAITGAAPGGSVAILTADGAGGAIVPGGPCAGAEIPIGPAGLAFRAAVPTDGAGAAAIRPTIPDFACGLTVAALDLTTCEASAPVMLSGPAGEFQLYAAAAGATTGVWGIDLVAGTTMMVSDPGVPITGLTSDGRGTIYAIEGGGLAVGNPTAGAVSVLDPMTGSLRPVALTDQVETSIAFADGLLYTSDENTSYLAVDPATGSVTPLGGIPDGGGYGFAEAYDGAQMWRLNDTELHTVDGVGNTTLVAPISGLPGGNGAGAVFYDGQLWIMTDDGRGGSGLFSVDPVTGAATWSGISVPSGDIDALTAAM